MHLFLRILVHHTNLVHQIMIAKWIRSSKVRVYIESKTESRSREHTGIHSIRTDTAR